MPFLRDVSIRERLMRIIMLTSMVALLLACLAFAAYELVSFRNAMSRELLSMANIVGANSTAALLFGDPEAGEETLTALSADPRIVSACIYDSDARVFATYLRDDVEETVVPPEVRDGDEYLENGYLNLFRPIILDQERIGTIHIQADLRDLYARLKRYGVIALVVLASSSLVAFLLSSALQRLISRPILNLVKTANTVSQKRDYEIRVTKEGDDEVGLLIDAFNEMLSQIHLRDETLREAHHELETRAKELQRELSERKRAEKALQETEEQLQQSQKMEAVGMLAGGIAHDFNNLLVPITGYSELLMARLEAGSPSERYAEQIRKSAERAASLVSQLLAFSRKQVLQPKVLGLNTVVEDTHKMLERLIGEHIELVTILDPGLGPIKADPGRIEQVVMNLAVNARDAMPTGGKLTIETANVTLDEDYARKHMSVKPGPYVLLAVSDTGSGMDEKTRALIFEPFFTTKDKSKGTGLGLSTVYGIVKQSGGSIWVYSEIGVGSTFKVYLPRIAERVDLSRSTVVRDSSASGSETILVVEDEEDVRNLVCEVLGQAGYRVLRAGNGREGIQASESLEGPIHLLVTDVVMPGMSGREMTGRISPLRPAMKVLYMSGYTDNAIVHHGVLDPGTAYLQKPFASQVLLDKVREVLDGLPAASRWS